MWTRSDLKAKAKGSLKGNYWLALAAVFIVGVITSVCSGTSMFGMIGHYGDIVRMIVDPTVTSEQIDAAVAALSGKPFPAFLSTVLSIFVVNPLTVGTAKFFVRSAAGENKLGNIGGGFKGNYTNVVWTMFKRDFFVSLWSLLFVIPGIIKAYQYAMVDYILAENPNISAKEAMNGSREMMRGNKWKFFVLQLSFIGWFLLGLIVCGIGVIFVMPYYCAAIAQFYQELKAQNGGKVFAEVID